MITEEMRSYEVSLWTLQDEFITVLKWPDVEQQGRIQEPKMNLNVDGTQTFTFKIPMYLYYYANGKAEKKENPIWYNTRNGNLIASMRKVKVIFDDLEEETPNLLVDDPEQALTRYIPANYRGNVSLANRYIISPTAMQNAGYSDFSGSYATLYSSANVQNDLMIIYTPIDATGHVYSKSNMQQYLQNELGSATTVEEVFAKDTRNLVLECFSINEYATEQEAIDFANYYGQYLHELQAEWDIVRYQNNWFGHPEVDANHIFSQNYQKWKAIELRSKNTFEFLITKVTEEHQNDQLFCTVETEGLAFNELGKIGYKYTLNLDEVALDQKELEKTEGINAVVHTTIDYWVQKIGLKPFPSDPDPNTWYYSVEMDWSSFGGERVSNKIYTDEYVSSWQLQDNTIKPRTIQSQREKERIIDVKESNLYNITQTIAETFEVFCRYEYGYDENYHIISKQVIFYNNFINEQEGFQSITYPYGAKSISRNMDSTNLTTKLFVQSSDMDNIVAGTNNIALSTANKTKEDYLLNFDYLYSVGGINEDQYKEIPKYEAKILQHNNTIIPLQEQANAIMKRIIDAKAEQKVAENSIELDNKQTDLYKQKLEAYDNIDAMVNGKISITQTAPKLKVLIPEDKENNLYTINLGDQDKGIDPGSVKVYRIWNSGSGKCYGLINEYVPAFNVEDNILIRLDHVRYNPLAFDGTTAGRATVYALTNDPTTPPNQGWSEDYPEDITDPDTIKDDTPIFRWKNEYVVYNNGYIQNNYSMTLACSNLKAYSRNIRQYITSKKPIYYYTKGNTVPSVPSTKIENSSTSLDTWTTGLRNYEEDVKCYITYQIEYNYFTVEEVLNNNQGISGTNIEPRSSIKWEPTVPIKDTKYNTLPSSSPYVYVTYDYFPKLYYDKLIEFWSKKAGADATKSNTLLTELGDDEVTPKTGLYGKYDDIATQLKNVIADKEKTIKAFECMMGPALREGYWTPEDYNDYGDEFKLSESLGDSWSTPQLPTDSTTPVIGWDDQLFDDEIDSYYELTVDLTKMKYPCINLETVYGSYAAAISAMRELIKDVGSTSATPGFIYSDSNCRQIDGNNTEQGISSTPVTMISNPGNDYNGTTPESGVRDPKYVRLFALGTDAIFSFGIIDNKVTPILILTGAKSLADFAIEKMKSNNDTGGHPVIGKFKYVYTEGTTTINNTNSHIQIVIENCQNIESNAWVNMGTEPIKIVYPRIRIRSDALDDTRISVSYGNNTLLKNYEDYKIAFRTNTKSPNNYYTETCITLKNEVLLRNYNSGLSADKVQVKYTLSNANTLIYLDALKVLKENSIPKVDYQVATNVLTDGFIKTLYSRLASILMINDSELKFENVFGYISAVELDLDQPQNDTIEVKNYKTKFEDLFSTIVAQTEEMKRNAGAFSAMANGEVALSSQSLESALNNGENQNILNAYLDSHFDGAEVVQAKLGEVISEAGMILGAASGSLDRLYGLTLKNADILSGFVENIAADLTPHVYYGIIPPDTARTGDIFYQTDPETGEVIGHWLGNTNGGYTKTFDGKLSQITGATMNVNADKGIIEILAGTKIDMKTGGDLYIAANENINIVGNKSVNIGGGAINIAALATDDHGVSIVAVNEGDAFIASKVYELLLSKIKKSTNYAETDFTNSKGQNRGFKNALDSIKSTNGNNYRFNFGDGIIYEVAKASLEDNGVFSYMKTYKWLSQKVTTTSLVDIKPKQIMMKSSNLIMKATSKILLVTSDGTMSGTSALQLSPDDGIFMGSGKGITLFAGDTNNNGAVIDYDEANQKISLKSGAVLGSTFQLKPDYLIFGVASLSATTNSEEGAVVEITKDHLVFGNNSGPLQVHTNTEDGHLIGDIKNKPNINISYNTSITGIEITKDKIGFATNEELKDREGNSLNINVRNLFLMNNEGIMFGTVKTNTNLTGNSLFNNTYRTQGSYVIISPSLIEIGSLSNLYINTNNFKLQTDSYKVENGVISGKTALDNTIMAIGMNLQNITANTKVINGKFTDSTEQNAYAQQPDVSLLLNKNGLYIKGTVYATAGKFTGAVEASSFVAVSNGNGKLLADALHLGFYNASDQPIMTLNSGAMTVAGSFNLTADNLLINSNPSTGDAYFRLGSSTDAQLEYTSSGLTVKGSITATSFTVVGNALSDIRSAAGLGTQAWGANWPQGQRTNGTPMTYLTLNSADIDGGILLTTGNGIVVPWVAPPGTSQAAAEAVQNFETPALVMNTTGLQYRYMPVIASGSTYQPTDDIAQGASSITINKDGVTLSGSNISVNSGNIAINGKNIWSHENIIIMNPNIDDSDPEAWRKTVGTIETHMTNKHDWVLIKPFYNATINYSYNESYYVINIDSPTIQIAQAIPASDDSFGNGASWYQYEITGIAHLPADETPSGPTLTAYLGNSVEEVSAGIVQGSTQIGYGDGQQFTITIRSNNKNLCTENSSIYFKIGTNAGKRTLSNIQIECTTDSTVGRVPCTVYYYS